MCAAIYKVLLPELSTIYHVFCSFKYVVTHKGDVGGGGAGEMMEATMLQLLVFVNALMLVAEKDEDGVY